MAREFVRPIECPVCGEAVPRGARACPGCGADERSGWDEAATRYDGMDLPDEAFDDAAPARRRAAGAWFWPVVGWVILAALIGVFILPLIS